MIHYENIPVELKRLNQWVCTRSDSKVPMKAFENEAASSTNPQTWATFDIANNAVSKGFYDYCGFVFADNGYVGIDIDTGYDKTDFSRRLPQTSSESARAIRRNPRAAEVSIFS